MRGALDTGINYYHESWKTIYIDVKTVKTTDLLFSQEYIQWKTVMTMYICILCRSDAVIVSVCLYKQHQKQFEIVPPDE